MPSARVNINRQSRGWLGVLETALHSWGCRSLVQSLAPTSCRCHLHGRLYQWQLPYAGCCKVPVGLIEAGHV
jgi:hypothetical protein